MCYTHSPPHIVSRATQALAHHLRDTLERAQANLAKSQERQAHQANKRRIDLEFKMGDQVLLSRCNLRHVKLDAVWLEPYPITERIFRTACRLDLCTLKTLEVMTGGSGWMDGGGRSG